MRPIDGIPGRSYKFYIDQPVFEFGFGLSIPQHFPIHGTILRVLRLFEGEAYIKNYHDPDFTRSKPSTREYTNQFANRGESARE